MHKNVLFLRDPDIAPVVAGGKEKAFVRMQNPGRQFLCVLDVLAAHVKDIKTLNSVVFCALYSKV